MKSNSIYHIRFGPRLLPEIENGIREEQYKRVKELAQKVNDQKDLPPTSELLESDVVLFLKYRGT